MVFAFLFGMSMDYEVFILADRHDVVRALTILVDNAVKFSRDGERTALVRVSARPDNDGAALEVADNGVGIAPEHVAAIFDRFYRVGEARSNAGAGLGLAIARQIMDHRGGTLTVRALPGADATFTLWFPPMPPGRYGASVQSRAETRIDVDSATRRLSV